MWSGLKISELGGAVTFIQIITKLVPNIFFSFEEGHIIKRILFVFCVKTNIYRGTISFHMKHKACSMKVN